MLNLIKKDILIIKRIFLMSCFVLTFVPFFFAFMNSHIESGFSFLFMSVLAISIIGQAISSEEARFPEAYAVLCATPYRRRSIVCAKYIEFLALFCGCFVINGMALDEKSNWKKMVFAMPLSKYAEVASKYLLSLLLGIISAGFVFLFGVLFAYGLPNLTKGWDEVIAYSGVSFCICVLYNAIMIPATYKFGASKSRMVLLVIVAILPTVGTLIMKKTGIKLSTIALTPQTIVMLCLGGILVIEFVSFMLSIKIRKKRE